MVLTTHFGVNSTNYQEEKSLQALTHANGVGISEYTLLSDHKTGHPNGGTPKKGSKHAQVMNTEDDVQ